mmetsp:Transcript_27270/g.68277  ORF Transcript_27270/g.68277 Transcript_27270/m.68277 type:complete len:200 (-) Transcript_27270:32-631(-)
MHSRSSTSVTSPAAMRARLALNSSSCCSVSALESSYSSSSSSARSSSRSASCVSSRVTCSAALALNSAFCDILFLPSRSSSRPRPRSSTGGRPRPHPAKATMRAYSPALARAATSRVKWRVGVGSKVPSLEALWPHPLLPVVDRGLQDLQDVSNTARSLRRSSVGCIEDCGVQLLVMAAEGSEARPGAISRALRRPVVW